MQTARVARLVALAAATVLLAVGAWSSRSAFQSLNFERREAVSARSKLQSLEALMPEVAKREEFARLSLKVTQQAAAMGFNPTAWAERRVSRISGPVSRSEASNLLGQIDADGGTRFFAADNFELSVASREGGLFTPPAYDDKGLVMAFSGTLHFPLAARP